MAIEQALIELQRRVEASNQKQVASELSVSPSFLCDVLKGRREMTEKLADALGFDPAPQKFVKRKASKP